MNHNPRMVTNTYSKWGVRLGTLVLWAAAGASVVYWGLRLSAPSSASTAPAVAPAPVAMDAQALAQAFRAHGTDWQAALARYERLRRPATTALTLANRQEGLAEPKGAVKKP